MAIDTTKPLELADGRSVRFLCIDEDGDIAVRVQGGEGPRYFHRSGCHRYGSLPDLRNVAPIEHVDHATTPALTGGSSGYYKLHIASPTSGGPAYDTECNDIIEALDMNFAEGNAFKALWRIAADRAGRGKPGTTALYDSEKVVFFGQRLVAQNGASG